MGVVKRGMFDVQTNNGIVENKIRYTTNGRNIISVIVCDAVSKFKPNCFMQNREPNSCEHSKKEPPHFKNEGALLK